MTEPQDPRRSGVWAMIGAGAAMLACCGGPALLAGGAVSALGGALRSPWIIAGGVVVMPVRRGLHHWGDPPPFWRAGPNRYLLFSHGEPPRHGYRRRRNPP